MQKKQVEPQITSWLHNRGSQLGLPIQGNFELTARCNFHCPMCYVHLTQEQIKASGKRELTAAEWIGIAEKAAARGMAIALLTGGEPFARRDFFEIYNAMKSMGLLVAINSNGSMLDGEIREQLLENPPHKINITLYGGSNETYHSMCGQDAFDRVINNIRALRKVGINVTVNCSITPYNKQDFEKIYQITQELDVHMRPTSYMFPSVRVNGSQYGCGDRLSAEESAQLDVQSDLIRFTPEEFEQRAQAMKELRAVEPSECMVEQGDEMRCRAGSSSFWMTWDGRMLPCGMMPEPVVYPLEVGFDAAWDALRSAKNAIHTPKECSVCPKKELCRPCAAMCITETGAFDRKPEYLCRHTDALIRYTCEAYEKRSAEKHED